MQIVSVVAVYIKQDGKTLLVQEKGQAWGLWSIPLGHVDKGESLKEAAKREVKEETGYEVEILNKLGKKVVSDKEYKGGEKDKGKKIEITFFYGEITNGELKTDLDDLLDVKWVEKNSVSDLPLRGNWLKDFIS